VHRQSPRKAAPSQRRQTSVRNSPSPEK
jgi:hypothetical protein